MQKNEAHQRQTIRDQALTIEKLKGSADSDDSSANGEQSHPKKKKKSRPQTRDDALRKDTLQAGKRFAVQCALWTDPGAVRYVALLNKDGPDNRQSDESEDDDELRAQAELIYETLPAHLRPHVEEGWFRERVR